MKYQSRKSSCGPASLANALEAIGIERTEDELGTLAKQDATGTSSINLRKAAEAVGVDTRVVAEQRWESAYWALNSFIGNGNPGLLIVDNDEHWVSVVGKLGDTFIVTDPADNDLLLFYSGTKLLERWKNESDKYCGFFIERKES
jgi:ABC-type bacteriocin/lantibiotic exporter with double-glycine peptidase domain